YFYSKTGDSGAQKTHMERARQLSPDRVFPNRLYDIIVLTFILNENPKDDKAYYYLGNLWYDKRQYEEAKNCWELAVKLNPGFPTTQRNLGIVYYNKFNEKEQAILAYEKAFACSLTQGGDARILFELDQLYKQENEQPNKRLQ